MRWLHLGFGLYVVNLLVGLLAQLTGRRFGVWHHALYAVVFGGAIVAAVFDFHPGLIVVLAALAVFPKARPRTRWHPGLAGLGLAGYLAALTVPAP
jgi:hypothetical protein